MPARCNTWRRATRTGRLKRASLHNAVPWARSVIVCAINYNTAQPYSTQLHDPKRGWISRYAWSREDYHEAVMRKLQTVEARLREANGDANEGQPALQTLCYVDTGPVVERVYAKYAGVGWIGKNTCILNQKLGSWLFLGVILTSLETCAGYSRARSLRHLHPLHRCLPDASPDRSLSARLQPLHFLSHHRKAWRRSRRAARRHGPSCLRLRHLPGRLPLEPEVSGHHGAEFQPREGLVNPALEWIAEMGVEEFRETFRKSPVRRAKRNGLRRNAAIAMGNSGDPGFLPALEKLAQDEDSAVAEHARWARKQIVGQ